MILFLGICLILGAGIDSVLGMFSFNHLLVGLSGLLVILIDLLGSKINFLKGIGKSVISSAVLVVVLVMIVGISTKSDPVDKEITDILTESDKVLEDKDYKAAIKVLQDYNTDLGWNKDVNLRIAQLYMDQEMYADGANEYYYIMTQLPDDLEMRSLFAHALYLNKDYNGAMREAEYIIKINPEYSDAYILKGDVYAAINDHFREIYYYKIAVGLDKKSIVNRIKLAEAYGSSNSSKEAIEQYEIAKTLTRSFEEKNLIYESYLRFANADSEQSR